MKYIRLSHCIPSIDDRHIVYSTYYISDLPFDHRPAALAGICTILHFIRRWRIVQNETFSLMLITHENRLRID